MSRRQGPGRPGSPANGRKGETEAELKHLLVPLPLCIMDRAHKDGAQKSCRGACDMLGTWDVSSLLWAVGRECPCPEGPRDGERAPQTRSQETQTPVWALPLAHLVASYPPPPPPAVSLNVLFCQMAVVL